MQNSTHNTMELTIMTELKQMVKTNSPSLMRLEVAPSMILRRQAKAFTTQKMIAKTIIGL